LIELLVLAVAPGLFFTWFFYVRDKYEKEPKSLIIVTFILGMLSIVPALFLSLFLGVIFPDVGGFFQILLHYLVVVALVEEVAKFSAVLRAYQSSEFDEIMDGMVYSATAALGFATVENVFYVLSGGLQTGILRAILSVPGHGLNGSMMGYYLGRAKLNEGRRNGLLLRAMAVPILFHWIWDSLLVIDLGLVAILVYVVQWVITFRMMREAVARSPYKEQVYPVILPFLRERLPQDCPYCGHPIRYISACHRSYCDACKRYMSYRFCPFCGKDFKPFLSWGEIFFCPRCGKNIQ
jgi:RsiW-degrading membrane proteinase PrsW (M82 family)